VDYELSGLADVPNTSASILRILATVKPESQFLEDQIFAGDQLLDSLDLIRLVGELDEAFGISIPGFELVPQNFESVESISVLVRKYKQEVSPDG
jgi:D-alanine--poly(phosphoribitol) ligase subunit 2